MRVEHSEKKTSAVKLKDYPFGICRLAVIEKGYGGWEAGMVLWIGCKETWCLNTESHMPNHSYHYEDILVRPLTGSVTLTPEN